MSKINSLILSFLSLITYSNCMKSNEVFMVHKDKSILEKVVFDQLFTLPYDETVTPEEETIILSPKNKRPIPQIEKPRIDLSAFTDEKPWKPRYDTKCAHYKRGSDLDLEKILGKWKVVYYKLPHDIPCFEVEIKLNSYEEKKRHYDMYGDLSDNVDWNLCNLEIKSEPGTVASQRKHFLLGSVHNRGVMDNIIIEQIKDRFAMIDVELHNVDWNLCNLEIKTGAGTSASHGTHFLHRSVHNRGIMDNVIIEEVKDRFGNVKPMIHEENSDQWLVIKDLLLMRDCDTGDIVIFTRIPRKQRREDILDALMVFGEDEAFGSMACLLD